MDSRLKFVELPDQFKNRANDIILTCKQHLRTCEQLAIRLSREKPKTSQEFEQLEFYKDFVIKTSQLNEQVLGLVEYTYDLLNQIANDNRTVKQSLEKDTIRLQSETIEILTEQRDRLIKEIHDSRRNSFLTE